jgi:hypothetical protein
VHVTLRWHSLIRFRRVAVWVCVFVWESINRVCVQRMSDNKKSSGVRDRPSGRKDEYGLGPAAAALTLASIGVSVLRSVYTFHCGTIGPACICRAQRFNDNQHCHTNGMHTRYRAPNSFRTRKIGSPDLSLPAACDRGTDCDS